VLPMRRVHTNALKLLVSEPRRALSPSLAPNSVSFTVLSEAAYPFHAICCEHVTFRCAVGEASRTFERASMLASMVKSALPPSLSMRNALKRLVSEPQREILDPSGGQKSVVARQAPSTHVHRLDLIFDLESTQAG
jgi:hypothetical protein